ncbi:CBS domain-containing protein [Vibrio genomosp. F10]|uniref:Acetoin utilization protein AcuB n=3 Tax=Vibrio TaxID=662 RepID=A0A1B9R2D4_9VIBR|nr:CBS domain-containing protein [Vibrio genomosp. F10]OCH78325.1 acetoin utilization protein AcuB [Vibrio genomosp. F10]OEE31580.1 acetoin utilization protein AcuB [Vibrio genomosp. F10 str. ZF-129]OEE95205.1 acetoin utilization protein AcuB [Vibrio genomosp. F10 str. 9ZC157]OEF01074.1 acetoin utilization protein AcuB [Vibrio genomosp. F10 str. 9ZD137]OEF08121.1 acetoin utilization protein AcuB [Vibrio genomosp. F10 str. 9ZB36]
MIKVEDMMTRNPHTLLRSHTLSDAKNMMEALDIRHIPVVDAERKVLGIITQRGVLAAQESSLQKLPSDQSYTLSTPLNDVMHTKIMTVSPHAGLKESAKYMQKHKVGCLPIVDGDELVGIITDSDFVSIAITLLELQEDSDPEEAE